MKKKSNLMSGLARQKDRIGRVIRKKNILAIILIIGLVACSSVFALIIYEVIM